LLVLLRSEHNYLITHNFNASSYYLIVAAQKDRRRPLPKILFYVYAPRINSAFRKDAGTHNFRSGAVFVRIIQPAISQSAVSCFYLFGHFTCLPAI